MTGSTSKLTRCSSHTVRRCVAPCCICVVFGCATQPPPGPAYVPAAKYPASAAPDWNDLFDGTEGWTGADGIFAVSIDGRDAFGSADHDTRTVFWFSDTMVGTVNESGGHARGSTMINNSSALLRGDAPDEQAMTFYWPRDDAGTPRSVFLPQTPASHDDEWYWLGDGFVRDDVVTIFAYRMTRRGEGGVFDFLQRGHVLIRAELTEVGELIEREQIDLPLDSPARGGRTELSLAGGVLLNDESSGARNPDGWLYVYGTWNRFFDKELVAARVDPDRVADPRAWRFWTGDDWSASLDDLQPVCGGVSSELSVTPLPDGRYLLTFIEGGLSEWVSVRLGETPVGPFGPIHRIWRCPEVDRYDDAFTYNAKAHPHLSRPGEVLISYNVNSFDFWGEFLADATIYRPRFIRLPLNVLVEWE